MAERAALSTGVDSIRRKPHCNFAGVERGTQAFLEFSFVGQAPGLLFRLNYLLEYLMRRGTWLHRMYEDIVMSSCPVNGRYMKSNET